MMPGTLDESKVGSPVRCGKCPGLQRRHDVIFSSMHHQQGTSGQIWCRPFGGQVAKRSCPLLETPGDLAPGNDPSPAGVDK